MSATEPADSGGGPTIQNLQVTAIDMSDLNKPGSWALLMEEEEIVEVAVEDDEDNYEVDGAGRSPERKREIPHEPPFKAQVTNVSHNHDSEELLYYFGGEDVVKHFEVFGAKGNALFEFHSRDGLLSALEKNQKEFQGKTLRVFVMYPVPVPARVSNRNSSVNERSSYGSYDGAGSRRGGRDGYGGGGGGGYNRGNSRYSSQSSLNNDGPPQNRYDKGGNYNSNRNPNQYGTMPAGGFYDRKGSGGYNDRDGGNRNSMRKPRGGGGYIGYNNSYEDRYNGGGPLQRSESYQNNFKHPDPRGSFSGRGRPPAPINSRSRTDSHSTNVDGYSRASSRMSVEQDQPKQVQRKPSANPFGEAKPVDTQAKLLEIEARQAAKEKQEAEARAAELAAQQQQQQQIQSQTEIPSPEAHHQNRVPYGQYQQHGHHNDGYPRHGHHYGPPHHNQHQHNESHRRDSFEGATVGSVTIKKRVSTDIAPIEARDDASPPIDPVQYERKTVEDTRNTSQSSEKARKYAHNIDLPPAPYHKSKNHVRPSTTTYTNSEYPMQKSAAMGKIEVGQKTNDVDGVVESGEKREYTHDKGGRGRGRGRGGRGSYSKTSSHKGDRRSSFSGSEKNVAGKDHTEEQREAKSSHYEKKDHHGSNVSLRGASGRGGKSTRGRGGMSNSRHNEPKNGGSSNVPTVDTRQKLEKTSEKTESVAVKAEKSPVGTDESSTTTTTTTTSIKGGSGGDGPATPKKKDKKKEKKKEAKTGHLAGNKFAALAALE